LLEQNTFISPRKFQGIGNSVGNQGQRPNIGTKIHLAPVSTRALGALRQEAGQRANIRANDSPNTSITQEIPRD
jgi:hypothetical protein